jgi:O-antigen ligase
LELSNRLSPENDPFIYRSESLGVVLGFDFHPVQYVGFIEMILPVPLAMVLGRGLRRDQAFLFGFMAIAMGVMLVTSNTTGGVLIVGLELVVLVLLHQWKRRLGPAARRRLGTGRLALVVSVVVLGIVGGLWWVGHRSVPQMVSSDLTRELQGITASGPEQINNRMKIWMTTLEIIKDYPVFGVGLGGMPAAYTRYDHSPGLVQMNAAHNDWLQLLSETGLVGGVLLVLFLIFLARLGKTSFIMGDGLGQSIGLGATVGCVGIIAHSLFDFYLQSPANIWFFVTLLGVLVGVVRVVETKEAYE